MTEAPEEKPMSPQMEELVSIQKFIDTLPEHYRDAIVNTAQVIRLKACLAPPEIAAAAISLVAAESAAGVLDVALEVTRRQALGIEIIMPKEKRKLL